MNEWISVKERLPELNVEVLVTEGTVIDIAGLRIKEFLTQGNASDFTTEWYSYGYGWNPEDNYGPPSHWMPLPDLPEKNNTQT